MRIALNGYLAGVVAVLVWASYPVATRAALGASFDPESLVALRFGVSALVFAPYLLLRGPRVARATWLRGVLLALFHGAGMATLAITGMQLAPASHAAALGPGVTSAWVAALGFLLFGQRPSARAAAGAALCLIGALLLVFASASAVTLSVLAGDAMFLAASALAALYVLQLRRWQIDAVQGAALVSLYSALVVVPYYLCTSPDVLARSFGAELAWQVLWQGVLIGCVAVVALNHAVARLGSARATALVSFVPVLAAFLAFVFLGESLSALEIAALVAISAGVSIGAAPLARVRPEARRPAGPSQTDPRAGYPAPGSAP